ncbi:MAG: hypothetical protein IJ880_00710 [Bacilli bacterium]|nr:hypothetical protein [Bacilli bacterium]
MIKVLIQYEIDRYTLECLDLGIFDVGKTLDDLFNSFQEALELYNETMNKNYKLSDCKFILLNLKGVKK